MTFWERDVARLGFVMVDEMNAAGGGTVAQQECLAMAWIKGFEFAHGGRREAEAIATIKLSDLRKSEPYLDAILANLRRHIPSPSIKSPESCVEGGI